MKRQLTWFGRGVIWVALVFVSAVAVMFAARDMGLGYLDAVGLTAVANILPAAVWGTLDR